MQMTLRSMFLICLNAHSSHWKLELFNNDMDRFTALRLAEINAEEIVLARRETAIVLGKNLSKMTDSRTSQHPHRSNFRNEQSREKLTDGYFKHGLHDRSAGKLDFDYVSTSRPCMHSAVPMSDVALNDVLMARNLQVDDLITCLPLSLICLKTYPPLSLIYHHTNNPIVELS